eukprot:scaffold159708_cov53-Cyclotella_meneghiniana.AAC.3
MHDVHSHWSLEQGNTGDLSWAWLLIYSGLPSSVPPRGDTIPPSLAWRGGDSPKGVLLYDLKSGCFEPIATSFGPPVITVVTT